MSLCRPEAQRHARPVHRRAALTTASETTQNTIVTDESQSPTASREQTARYHAAVSGRHFAVLDQIARTPPPQLPARRRLHSMQTIQRRANQRQSGDDQIKHNQLSDGRPCAEVLAPCPPDTARAAVAVAAG